MKLYTKTGDQGLTGLIGGRRVAKDDLRVSAYGEVDETNAVLGVVISGSHDPELKHQMQTIQDRLFVLGAELANPAATESDPAIRETDITQLENWIDAAGDSLPPLRQFILPGGSESAARLHLARTVCRRAERAVVTLSHSQPVSERAIIYLNRLSDLCFAWARQVNHRLGVADVTWRAPQA